MIRNFSIIAHIDHGKSTLADRFLELTHTLRKEEMREQFLDQMDLERERGITIKMQPCFMEYEFEGKKYQLNLIDTPGHMDFAYEVERSLSAVEAVILLVDVNCGVQAQTLANFQLAKSRGLKIIPVLNKIDACYDPEQIERVKQEVASLTGVGKDEILAVSAKTGLNVEKILERLIKEAPAPKTGGRTELEALVFDSFYDNYQGVIACVRIFSGQVKKGDQLFLLNQKRSFPARDIGIFKPRLFSLPCLEAGRIGYIATGIKEPGKVRVGDTITKIPGVEALPGYLEPKPMVFAGIYPENAEDFELLKIALAKLKLSDAAFTFEPEMKEAL
ncbi:MAG: GTP-binding protein, partial [Patescibacteria group bacterium]